MVKVLHEETSRQAGTESQRKARSNLPIYDHKGRIREDSRQGQSSRSNALGISAQSSIGRLTMAQHGFVFRKGGSWFLRYRHDVPVNGVNVRKQKCVKLADYGDRYRCASDLDDLAAEKMAGVRQAAKCPQ